MTITPRKMLKTFSIIHLSLFMAPLFVGIFLYFNTVLADNAELEETTIFTYIFPIIGLAGILVGKSLYAKFINPLKQKASLQQKLAGFQSAALMQYALIEGPALLNIAWFSITGNLLYLTIGGVLLIYLLVTSSLPKLKLKTIWNYRVSTKASSINLDEPL